jgi:HK97 gp10 family phage protein
MDALVVITGVRELDKQLKKLDVAIGKKVLRQASRASFKPALEAARANAPNQTGRLKKAIKLVAVKRSRRGRVGMKVQVGADMRAEIGKYYASMHEHGAGPLTEPTPPTKKRTVKAHTRRGSPVKAFKRRGPSIPASHYMRDAFQSTKAQVEADFNRQVLAGIERELAAVTKAAPPVATTGS